jgi:hypothetical protein
MKKQIAKTVTILSLFVVLSLVASNVYAFPVGCPSCASQSAVYAVTADAKSDVSGGFMFWVDLAMLFAGL